MELLEIENEWIEIREIVFEALDKLPQDVHKWALENLYFLYPPAVFSESIKNLSSKKGIVFITEKIKDYSEEEQAYLIAHAIAHRKLNHSIRLREEEAIRLEREADELAFSWLPFKVMKRLIEKGWKRCDKTGIWYHPRHEMCIQSAFSIYLFH